MAVVVAAVVRPKGGGEVVGWEPTLQLLGCRPSAPSELAKANECKVVGDIVAANKWIDEATTLK